jgi:hypothetical protein
MYHVAAEETQVCTETIEIVMIEQREHRLSVLHSGVVHVVDQIHSAEYPCSIDLKLRRVSN